MRSTPLGAVPRQAVFEVCRAFLRQADSARRPMQQSHAEMSFKASDALTDCRARNAQPLARPREALVLHRPHEGEYVVESILHSDCRLFVPSDGIASWLVARQIRINGLLPQIASDLNVSIPQAGLLISGFAAGIIVGAPVLTIATLRQPQKRVLQGALVLFIAGSALSAAAPDYLAAMTACSFGAIATTFTYIAPLLQEVSGFSPRAVTGVLFVIGLGLFVGNYIGGKAADKNLMGALIVLFASFTIVLMLFGFTAHYPIAAVISAFLFGVAGYGLVLGAQLRVVAVANDAPTLASALNISAFNVGVMIGAALGAAAIDAKLGTTSVTWIGACVAGIGFVLAMLSRSLDRSHAVSAPHSLTHEIFQPTAREGSSGQVAPRT
jgi:predicted MFS family arabinose efflux permease